MQQATSVTSAPANNSIQLLVFEETSIKIYRCAKGDIDRRDFDIGLFKHQLVFYYFSVSSVGYYCQKGVK